MITTGDIKASHRSSCMVCNSALAEPVISLPRFPLTEMYIDCKPEPGLGLVDQDFHFCEQCGHGQLGCVVHPSVLYGSDYRTRTTKSSAAREAADRFLDFIAEHIGNKVLKTVLEIGCNDLYSLRKLENRAKLLVGVDPILRDHDVGSYDEDKICLIGDFFENVDLKKHGIKPDLVFSSHTLEHVENPCLILDHVLSNCTDDALCFMQFPGLESLVESARFDQVFHQHLNYFSKRSVIHLFEKLGAEVLAFKVNPYHWGSLMVAFRKKIDRRKSSLPIVSGKTIAAGLIASRYQLFKDGMAQFSRRLAVVAESAPVYGFGAALMLPVLYYYVPKLSELDCILDDEVSKQGKYYLNYPVIIRSRQSVSDLKDSIIVVTAINSIQIERTLIKKLIKLKVREILVPLQSF